MKREWCAQPTLLYSGPEQLCKRAIWSDHGWTLERAIQVAEAAESWARQSVALSCRQHSSALATSSR